VTDLTVESPRTSPALIKFFLRGAPSDKLDIELKFSSPASGGSKDVLLEEGPSSLMDLAPSGTAYVRKWLFANQPELGMNLSTRVTLEARILDRPKSPPDKEEGLDLGNDAPEVEMMGPPKTTEDRGIVQVDFMVSDSSNDLVSIDVEYHILGESDDHWSSATPLGPLTTRIEALSTGTRSTFVWDVVADLGDSDREAQLRFTPDDQVTRGRGVQTTPFVVLNGSQPEVVVIEPVANPDVDGSVLLRFMVKDDEADPADVILQWSADSGSFPDLSDLVKDTDLRRRTLMDPDASAERRIATPRLRTKLEARCLVSSKRGENEVALTAMTPPAPLTESLLKGASLELLSDKGAVEQAHEITGVDPSRNVLRLREGLIPPPRQGQRGRIKETLPSLLFNLASSRNDQGTAHEFAWDAPADVGIAGASSNYFVRAVAISTLQPPAVFTSTVPKQVNTDPLRFSSGPQLVTGSSPSSLADADLDGDGYRDLISADSFSDQLAVFFGAAGGAFKDPLFLALPPDSRPTSVRAEDLNADGRLDLVSADFRSNQLSVFRAADDGSFSRQGGVELKTGTGPRAVLALDLDGDGDLDLASADTVSNRLSVFLATGEMDFSGPLILQTGLAPKSIAAGDLDGDGLLDLVSADSLSSELSVFLGKESGEFTRPDPPVLETGPDPSWVTAADLNGDGHLDLACAASAANQLSIFLGRGAGAFERLTPVDKGSQSDSRPVWIGAVDFNLDGQLDLCSADFRADQLSIVLGKGDGSFTVPSSGALRTGAGPKAAAMTDINGDGRPDLVSADSLANRLSTFLGNQDGALSNAAFSSLDTGASPRTALAADLDGDGHLDLVSADFGSSQLSIFTGSWNGTFARPTSVATEGPPTALGAGDINGDGALDLISASSGNNNDHLAVFFQKSPGIFGKSDLIVGSQQTTKGPRSILPADLDGDGDTDLLSANSDGNNLTIFFQGDDRSFSEAPDFFLGGAEMTPSPESVVAVDLNRDGALDIVSANFKGDNLTVFLQKVSRQFSSEPDLELGGPQETNGPFAVTAADLDEDGRLDLVSSDSRSGQLSVFLGKEMSGFGRPSSPALPTGPASNPRSVAAADFNNDGHLDLAVPLADAHQLFLFLGDGDGAFAPSSPRQLLSGNAPSALTAADLNGDGHLDLVSVDASSSQLLIFLNDARGPLSPAVHGTPRGPATVSRRATGGDLVLASGSIHSIDTSSGALDGRLSPDFQGHAFHFRSIRIEAGASLRVRGEFALALFASRNVLIQGEIVGDGESAQSPGGTPGNNAGTGGGRGGPGGGRGGNGGGIVPGTGKLYGSRGIGIGAGRGGRLLAARALVASGGGGGHGTPGTSSSSGGATYGNDRLEPLFGGSGGGGGSARDQQGVASALLGVGRGAVLRDSPSLDRGDEGGGGGGGGGGALRITAGEDIVLGGKISANGGDGGRGNAGLGGNGGGGSGGSILLQAGGQITLEPGSIVSAVGGKGASGVLSPRGGDGGDGRIRFEDADGVLDPLGTVLPFSQGANTGAPAR
jgi:hypothetical protein